MRGWQGHVKESCSYNSQWSDVRPGDDEAETFRDPSFPQRALFLCHQGCRLPQSFDLWQDFYKTFL